MGDLLSAIRPSGLPQSDVLPFDLAALEKDGSFLRHPDDQEKRQAGLNEQRQQD
jgi:hypothetical protein